MADRRGRSSHRAQTLVAAREMILRGEFASPQAIEEIELSRTLAASRPIIRETLEKRWQEGLLEQQADRRYVPRAITEEDIADAIAARGALESLAAGIAARRAPDPVKLERARRINTQLAQTTALFNAEEPPNAEDMARFAELNMAFHKATWAGVRCSSATGERRPDVLPV